MSREHTCHVPCPWTMPDLSLDSAEPPCRSQVGDSEGGSGWCGYWEARAWAAWTCQPMVGTLVCISDVYQSQKQKHTPKVHTWSQKKWGARSLLPTQRTIPLGGRWNRRACLSNRVFHQTANQIHPLYLGSWRSSQLQKTAALLGLCRTHVWWAEEGPWAKFLL